MLASQLDDSGLDPRSHLMRTGGGHRRLIDQGGQSTGGIAA